MYTLTINHNFMFYSYPVNLIFQNVKPLEYTIYILFSCISIDATE